MFALLPLMTTGAFEQNVGKLFSELTTGAFEQNVGKLFSELKLVTDNLSIYAAAN